MVPKSAFVLVSSLLLCAPLSAQDWIGEASVGIEVRDELGRSIPGAAVVLIREAGSSDSSPPFVFTDEGGQVEVLHLAEGEWQVEVRAAGYMIFNSYLKLSVSAPPVIGFSSRQRTGTFWEPLEVRFFHPGSGDVVLVAGTKSERKEEKKRRAQSRKLAKQDEKAVKRAEQRRHRKPTRGVDVAVLTPPQVAEAEPPPGAIPPPPPPPPAPEPSPAPVPPPALVATPPSAPATLAAEPVAPPAPEAPPPVPVEEVAEREAQSPPAVTALSPPAAEVEVPPTPSVAEPPPPSPPPPPPPPPPRSVPPPAEATPPAEPAPPPVPKAPPVFPAVNVEPLPPVPPVVPPAAPPVRLADASPLDVRGVPRPAEVVREDPPALPTTPLPRAPAPTVPSLQSHPVFFRGGACPECKPGEWALVVEAEASVTPAPESCGGLRDERIRILRDEVFGPAAASASAFGGVVADPWGNSLPSTLLSESGRTLVAELGEQKGACQDLIGVLPQGARFIGFRYEAEDEGGRGDCFGVEPCAIGEARWVSNPMIERTPTVTLIHASFHNQSSGRTRRARMTLYFRPPGNWTPP